MQLNKDLYRLFCEQAARVRTTSITIGLRYTAVTTDDGGIGIAFTDVARGHHCCGTGKGYRDLEGEPALELLEYIKDDEPLRRSMALALVNALNYGNSRDLPEDSEDGIWMDTLGVQSGTRVAMVGLFRPLMHKFHERGAQVEVLDAGQGIGNRDDFYKKLGDWAEVLILSGTSIINNTTEEVLSRISDTTRTVLLGPSTPLVPQVFTHPSMYLLAGTVPVDSEKVLKAVRHGQGTPVLHRYSRKVSIVMK
ncbi:MAG: Rossmann-like domain-containing protein [Desulfobulbus sp.]|jgi:uncharacterized protein (DUF4213/DUF364 family)